MSVRKAQNRIRKQYGVGKTALHKRMSSNRRELATLAYSAQWSDAWAGMFDAERHERMHYLVDALAADSVIATAYKEAEQAARGGTTERISPTGDRFDPSALPTESNPLEE